MGIINDIADKADSDIALDITRRVAKQLHAAAEDIRSQPNGRDAELYYISVKLDAMARELTNL